MGSADGVSALAQTTGARRRHSPLGVSLKVQDRVGLGLAVAVAELVAESPKVTLADSFAAWTAAGWDGLNADWDWDGNFERLGLTPAGVERLRSLARAAVFGKAETPANTDDATWAFTFEGLDWVRSSEAVASDSQ